MASSISMQTRAARGQTVGAGMVRGLALTSLIAAMGLTPARGAEPREEKPTPASSVAHCPTLIRFVAGIACPVVDIALETVNRPDARTALASDHNEGN